jgi:3-amino-4-hydroxybenzoic acid synthase
MKIIWLDIRGAGPTRAAIVEEAIHQRVDAIVAADPADLATIPPTVKRVLLLSGEMAPERLPQSWEHVDIVITEGDVPPDRLPLPDSTQNGEFVEVTDARTLEQACAATKRHDWSVLMFRDPTKIPLEIVLAAAQPASGAIITTVGDVSEAEIVFGVLERGSDGVLFPARNVGEITELRAIAATEPGNLDLVELEVTGTAHVGMGERACVRGHVLPIP